MKTWAGGFFRKGTYIYMDTGERYTGTPPRVSLGDPVKGITYHDATGRELRPA